ncbi:MAG: hypothetical protein WCW36_01820 [Candidatus Paceibacterota bacterium]
MMRNPLLDGIKRIRRLEATYTSEYEERMRELAIHKEQLRSYVLAGESTGDAITDYFLRGYSVIDSSVALPLRELEEKMRGKVGELFLVTQSWRNRWNHGPGGEDEYLFQKSYITGVLCGGALIFVGSRYGLPTKAFLVLGSQGIVLMDGPFLFPIASGIHAPNTIKIGTQQETEFEVVVGDTEVFECVPKTIGIATFTRIRREYGKVF